MEFAEGRDETETLSSRNTRPGRRGMAKTLKKRAEEAGGARIVLAGNELPEVWIPDGQTRDDRELLRARLNLGSLLRQMAALEGEAECLGKEIGKLSETPRYAEPVGELLKLKGVGVLVGMVFLTEMGDLSRFENRRQVGAYLGLVPSSDESGETDDRKGHITHHGSPRVRWALCQASWSRVRNHPGEKEVYERLVAKNPKKKKPASLV